MNLDKFKTVEQLSASMKTMLSGLRNFKGIAVGSVAPAAGEVTATGDIRTDGGIYAGNKAGTVGNDDIVADGDIYTVAWTDYSGTSTIDGWSSYTTKEIEYKKIGDMVFVSFRIVGTSDETFATFTLPHAEAQSGNPINTILTQDDSTWAIGYISVGGSTATCYQDSASGGFTASGTKGIYGQFFYEAT